MPDVSIENDNKNSLSITNEDKTGDTVTWDEARFTLDEGNFIWENVGLPINKESKNSLSISNENKP